MLKARIVLFAMPVVLMAAIVALLLFAWPHRGAAVEHSVTTNGVFKVRVTVYTERPSFGPGSYYAFEAAPAASTDWRPIMSIRHDLPPRSGQRWHVRFLNPRTGYVFMGWKYAVTTDAGATWAVWDAGDDLPGWRCCNDDLVQDVRLQPDGSGTMLLHLIARPPNVKPVLQTRDFGRHWQMIGPRATTEIR